MSANGVRGHAAEMRLRRIDGKAMGGKGEEVQMMACGSFALDVPSRNLRSFSFVSGENEYSRESDWWG